MSDSWVGAIRAYGQGLMEQLLLGMHDAANLERARTRYRQERQTINQQGPDLTTVVVAAAELSHKAAGRAAGQPFPPVGPGAVGADPWGGCSSRRWCLACSTNRCLFASGSRSRSMASSGCATGCRKRAS
jgi:hypothetical protein